MLECAGKVRQIRVSHNLKLAYSKNTVQDEKNLVTERVKENSWFAHDHSSYCRKTMFFFSKTIFIVSALFLCRTPDCFSTF